MDIEGVIPPVVTPVAGRDGDVAVDALRELARTLGDAGVDALFPCGTAGEFASLGADQRRRVVETVADAAGSATPVLAGCSDTSVAGVLAQARAADDAGADAAVVLTPYYFSSSPRGTADFFRAVADRSPLPVVAYHLPALTGAAFPVETVVDLAAHEGVVGVKDSSGDLARLQKLVDRTPASFAVLQGHTAAGVAGLDLGADGLVAGEANVVPGALVDAVAAHRDGARGRAFDRFRTDVLPVTDAVTDVPPVPAVKYLAGRALGRSLGPPLPPLPELTADQRTSLEGVV